MPDISLVRCLFLSNTGEHVLCRRMMINNHCQARNINISVVQIKN